MHILYDFKSLIVRPAKKKFENEWHKKERQYRELDMTDMRYSFRVRLLNLGLIGEKYKNYRSKQGVVTLTSSMTLPQGNF